MGPAWGKQARFEYRRQAYSEEPSSAALLLYLDGQGRLVTLATQALQRPIWGPRRDLPQHYFERTLSRLLTNDELTWMYRAT